MKLLLAVDASECSQEAVKQVTAHFNPRSTLVKVLYVLSPATYSTPPQMARGYAPEMEELLKEVPFNVEHLAEKLRTAGFVVEAGVEIGEVRSTIIDCAANWGADLIVIGSHGHKGLVRLLLGSVAESVVRHAACSVLVVRQSPSKP